FPMRWVSGCAALAPSNQRGALREAPPPPPGARRTPLPPRPVPRALRPELDPRVDPSMLMRFDPPEHLRTGAAFVVLPGGNYEKCSMLNEGQKVAVWLNSLGITAFVLRYRCIPEGHYWPAPMEDLELAGAPRARERHRVAGGPRPRGGHRLLRGRPPGWRGGRRARRRGAARRAGPGVPLRRLHQAGLVAVEARGGPPTPRGVAAPARARGGAAGVPGGVHAGRPVHGGGQHGALRGRPRGRRRARGARRLPHGQARARCHGSSARPCPGCRGPRGGGPRKRGSARAPGPAGSCGARGALSRVWVQDPAGSCRPLQDPARPD
ncbi:unnamed protein product, partial [Prorocentrum cordatum]